MKELLQKQRQLLAIYLVWLFLNTVVWALSDGFWSEKFWPFGGEALLQSYDFSEFLVYGIGPAILILAYLMFSKKD